MPGRGQKNRDRQFMALEGRADPSAMGARDGFGHRQADAVSAVLGVPGGVGTIEPLKPT